MTVRANRWADHHDSGPNCRVDGKGPLMIPSLPFTATGREGQLIANFVEKLLLKPSARPGTRRQCPEAERSQRAREARGLDGGGPAPGTSHRQERFSRGPDAVQKNCLHACSTPSRTYANM